MKAGSDDFRELMHFLDTSEMKEYHNPLVNDMAEALEKARTREEWRKDYMSIEMLKRDSKEEGRKEGRKEGREEGTRREQDIRNTPTGGVHHEKDFFLYYSAGSRAADAAAHDGTGGNHRHRQIH